MTALRISRLRHWARIVADLSIWPLAIAVAASAAIERAVWPALAVALFQIAARWLAQGSPFNRTRADKAILGLALMSGVSLAITARMDLTAPQVARLILGMVLYYAVVDWARTPGRLQLLYLGFVATGLLLALGALVSVDNVNFSFLPSNLVGLSQRLVGDGVNPNVMSGYLAILLPIIVGPALFAWREIKPQLWLLLLLTLVIIPPVLLLLQSRAGIAATILGLAMLCALRWRWILRIGLLTGSFLLLSLDLSAWQSAIEMFSRGGALGGLAEREELWSRAWYMIQDFFFTGVGMGLFGVVTDLLYPLFLAPPGVLFHAHNLFLQVAVDLGVPGLIAYLFTLGFVITMAVRTYVELGSTNASLRGMAAGIVASQVVLVAHGMFDAVTWGMVRPAVLVWAIWGAAAALWQLTETARSAEER